MEEKTKIRKDEIILIRESDLMVYEKDRRLLHDIDFITKEDCRCRHEDGEILIK